MCEEANLCIGMANERGAVVRRSESVYRDSERKSACGGKPPARFCAEKRTCISGWRTKGARAYGEANLYIGIANKRRAGEARGCMEKRICVSGWRTKAARGKRGGVRRSEFIYRDGERKRRGGVRRSESTYRDSERKSARAYGEANLYIGMTNAKSARRISLQRACVRRSELVYRDSEQKRRGGSAGRTEKRTSVSGWRTKDAQAYGEANLYIGIANKRRAAEARGVRRSESVYRDNERKSAHGVSLRRAFVRRSESTYRDGERKSAGVYGEANLCIGMANKRSASVRRNEPVYRDDERKRCGRTEKRTYVSGWRTKEARGRTEKRICISG